MHYFMLMQNGQAVKKGFFLLLTEFINNLTFFHCKFYSIVEHNNITAKGTKNCRATSQTTAEFGNSIFFEYLFNLFIGERIFLEYTTNKRIRLDSYFRVKKRNIINFSKCAFSRCLSFCQRAYSIRSKN